MNRRLEQDVERWLEAERAGRDDLADQALSRALVELERRGPSAGFADRVLAAAGRVASPSRLWQSRWTRAAVAALLVSAGLAVATLPAWLLLVAPIVDAFGSPVAAAWHWVGRTLATLALSWTVVEQVAVALRGAVATPAVVALVVGNVLLASASLFGLKHLLRASEELVPW